MVPAPAYPLSTSFMTVAVFAMSESLKSAAVKIREAPPMMLTSCVGPSAEELPNAADVLPARPLVAASSGNCPAQPLCPATQARDLRRDGQRAHGELLPHDRRAVIELETDGIEQQPRNDAFGRVSSQCQLHDHCRRLGCAAPCSARVLGGSEEVSLHQR